MYSVHYELSYLSQAGQYKQQERKVMLPNSSVIAIPLTAALQWYAGQQAPVIAWLQVAARCTDQATAMVPILSEHGHWLLFPHNLLGYWLSPPFLQTALQGNWVAEHVQLLGCIKEEDCYVAAGVSKGLSCGLIPCTVSPVAHLQSRSFSHSLLPDQNKCPQLQLEASRPCVFCCPSLDEEYFQWEQVPTHFCDVELESCGVILLACFCQNTAVFHLKVFFSIETQV